MSIKSVALAACDLLTDLGVYMDGRCIAAGYGLGPDDADTLALLLMARLVHLSGAPVELRFSSETVHGIAEKEGLGEVMTITVGHVGPAEKLPEAANNNDKD